jgi:RHS repeat-associated protein
LPFGEKLSATGATPNPFTFCGRFGVLDDSSGIYSMRARVYAPELGRFLSTDPGTILAANLYTYANNDPLAFVDPSGRNPRGDVNPDDNLNNALNNWQRNTGALNNALNGPGSMSDTASTWTGVATTAATSGDGNVATAGGTALTAIGGAQALSSGIVLFGSEKKVLDAINDLPELGGGKGGNSANGSTTQIQSFDPNDKIGVGAGSQGFVTGDGSLFYTVDFANETNATAPAQQVVITDRLDTNLDWSTFELQSIAFNNVNLTVPPGLQNYSNMVHVSTDPNPVAVTVSFNPQTGLIQWQMQSIDPITQALVADPLAGFLPPDNAQHAGEGYVTYTVRPKAALATGLTVVNQANIVFDVNAPILTPVVTNTIDHTPPVSSMTPLPASTPTTNLVVSWSGTDVGSGIASFDIYVSVNNGPWTVWLLSTTATSAVYPAAFGSSYAFYSVAIDLAGNVETSPHIPGAQTTVQLAQVPLLSAISLLNGQLQFNVLAASGNRYAIQTSTNFSNWSSLTTNTAPFVFVDPNYRNYSSRWYRAVLLP